MVAYPDWLSLHEIDTAAGLRKGEAFRAFKRALPALREGRDYRVLHHQEDREDIARLRAAGRIYATSINVVLVSAEAAQRLFDAPDETR